MQEKKIFVKLYGLGLSKLRKIIIWTLIKIEGGEYLSKTLRAIMEQYYNVNIDLYSHGACFKPSQFDRYTTVGRYCSFAITSRVMNRNHPMDFPSVHAFFFNPILSYVKEDNVEYNPLIIGSDVWFGYNSIIMPSVKNIGHGAVIGAGAVVAKDVPPYAVLVGNPARIVRYRFSADVIQRLLDSKWWEKPITELPIELMNSTDIQKFLGSIYNSK